jgi:hypothetical protein
MIKNTIDFDEENKEYYIATKDKRGEYVIYESELFKFSELDIITLIKICFVDKRNKTLGQKILEAYRDSTYYKKKVSDKKLNLIGVQDNGENKPITTRKARTK